MKKLLLLPFLTICILAHGQSDVSQQLNQLHKRKFQWMIAQNFDSLDWIMDASLKFIHSNGWIQSKKEFIDDLKSEKLNYTAIVVEESTVNIFNNSSAVILGKGIFKGLMPDKSEFNVHLLYTEVYVKENNQWRLVSRLACKLT